MEYYSLLFNYLRLQNYTGTLNIIIFVCDSATMYKILYKPYETLSPFKNVFTNEKQIDYLSGEISCKSGYKSGERTTGTCSLGKSVKKQRCLICEICITKEDKIIIATTSKVKAVINNTFSPYFIQNTFV